MIKQPIFYMLLVLQCCFLLLTGCEAGQVIRPTVTPLSTLTPIPTNTPMPTNTPAPTNTFTPTIPTDDGTDLVFLINYCPSISVNFVAEGPASYSFLVDPGSELPVRMLPGEYSVSLSYIENGPVPDDIPEMVVHILHNMDWPLTPFTVPQSDGVFPVGFTINEVPCW